MATMLACAPMYVLGIETSCDDTSLCLLKGTAGSRPEILAHTRFSQDTILREWGGVVPEIAARNHLAKLAPLISETFAKTDLKVEDVDLIGVTTHPGLLGPLLTGLNAAKTLALLYKKPIYCVNHLHAHLEAIHLSQEVTYPYLGLVVSGGHTLYMLVRGPNDFEPIGSTLDDAAGEAFDKGGKLLGLGYPAGIYIDQHAKNGNPKAFNFPIGIRDSKNSNFSFSGLKTSMRTYIEKSGLPTGQLLDDVCASYQDAIVRAIVLKSRYAFAQAKELCGKNVRLVVGGGVACNSGLRAGLTAKYKDTLFVEPKYCTDNGAMIANLSFLNHDHAISFPECLSVDARGRYIERKDFA